MRSAGILVRPAVPAAAFMPELRRELHAAMPGIDYLKPLLFQTATADPLTFAVVALLLLALAVLAGAAPAARAARIDPLQALRAD